MSDIRTLVRIGTSCTYSCKSNYPLLLFECNQDLQYIQTQTILSTYKYIILLHNSTIISDSTMYDWEVDYQKGGVITFVVEFEYIDTTSIQCFHC